MVTVPGFRRVDTVLPRGCEPEPFVVPGIAEQADDAFVERVGRRENGVHERAPDAGALVRRLHTQRAEPERVYPGRDRRARADDVADDRAVIHRDDRQRRYPCIRRTQE